MSLGNIKYQVTLALTGNNPTSAAVGVTKLVEILTEAGINVATNLNPQMEAAINSRPAEFQCDKEENSSIIATIVDGSQFGMMPQPMGWHSGVGMSPARQAGAGTMDPAPGYRAGPVKTEEAPAAATPADRRGYSQFMQTGQTTDGLRFFTQNWPLRSIQGANQFSAVVTIDEKGEDGLYREYEVRSNKEWGGNPSIQKVTFQRGEVNAESGPNGVRVEDLLVMCMDRLQCSILAEGEHCIATASPAKVRALALIGQALIAVHSEALQTSESAAKDRARWK
jgi:hypothetical protein